MQFSEEQQIAFDKYVAGENIFITGPGGAGKTALIKKIYQHATQYEKRIQVCALTGCAAVLLDCRAKTIHSWGGIGIGSGPIQASVEKVSKSRYKKRNWKEIDVLIIDEVSMMSCKLFDTLNVIGKTVRKSSLPFGGIQIIFSGDFYQLPPVGNMDEPETCQFCFESEFWLSIFPHENCIQLVKIFRQTDMQYINILNQIRTGKIKRSSVDLLQTYVNRESLEKTQPTKLYPTRHQADFVNSSELSKLTTEEKRFKVKHLTDLPIVDKNKPPKHSFTKQDIDSELANIQKGMMCEDMVVLKIGSHVMCVVNLKDEGLCNGSQGVVTRFSMTTGLPVVRFNHTNCECLMDYHTWASENIEGIGVAQIPLINAWALTIHKSQGTTLDVAEIDIGRGVFECGQTYVALSRIKSLEGLYLTSFDVRKITINKKVQSFYSQLPLLEIHRDGETEVS